MCKWGNLQGFHLLNLYETSISQFSFTNSVLREIAIADILKPLDLIENPIGATIEHKRSTVLSTVRATPALVVN